MTAILIKFDSEDFSTEDASNWIQAQIHKRVINAGFVSKIYINNKEEYNREEILQESKFAEKLKRQI